MELPFTSGRLLLVLPLLRRSCVVLMLAQVMLRNGAAVAHLHLGNYPDAETVRQSFSFLLTIAIALYTSFEWQKTLEKYRQPSPLLVVTMRRID